MQTIEIEGYTNTGFRVVIRDSVKDNEAAKKVIDSVNYLKLLPNRPEKPDELKYGKISHVALTYTEAGVPHVAFFHENEKLVMRWTHHYLDSEQERQEFEAWSGLKLAEMPDKEGNAHPQRSGKAVDTKYLVRLPSERALMRITTYEKVQENGVDVWQAENSVESYIMPKAEEKPASPAPAPSPTPAAPKHWSEDAAQITLVDGWIARAKEAKPKFYELACEQIRPMTEFAKREDYLEALRQIAANEEEKAKGEDIPF
jgi:hypothetical protein